MLKAAAVQRVHLFMRTGNVSREDAKYLVIDTFSHGINVVCRNVS